MANTPPGQITATANQVAPAKESPAQLTPLDGTRHLLKKELAAPAKIPPITPAALNVTGATPTGGSRGDATITIEILTDNYGSETSWEVVEWGGGVVGSGGGYASNTLYIEEVVVDSTSCYDFTIYDSYGDGICCAYGNGYYIVSYNGEEVCSGGEFASEETCSGIGGGCVWPTGACCVNQECVATNTEPECDDLGGTFYEGEDCFGDPPFECPASLVECPPGTLFGQNPDDPNASWSFATSGDTTSFTYMVYENFSDVGGAICDIHFWGLNLLYNAGWFDCDPEGVTFNIAFYPDVGGVPGDPVCTYTNLTPTYIGTGFYYLGYQMYYYTIPLLNPCCTLESGWVSIQSQMNDNDCSFLWASSGTGDSLQEDLDAGTPPAATGYDRGFCLTGEYEPTWGACCDDSTGICTNDVEQQDCPPPLRFTADTLCENLDPPCGEIPGACCYPDGTCEITTEMDCVEPGVWAGPYTDCSDCPPMGACCVDGVCVDNTWEINCDGRWWEGETCPEWECPDTDADFLIFAPIEGEVQDTCGAGNDCAARTSEDHTYEVVIPNDGLWTFSLCGGEATWDTYMYLGSSLCGTDIAYNDDYCGLVSQITQVPLTAGNYYVLVEAYSTACGPYALDVWEYIPPTGACCVDGVCVETNIQLECDGLGGIWYEGETCPEFECPGVAAEDFCENAYPVEVPSTTFGTTSGATIDSEFYPCGTSITAPGVWFSVIGTGNTMTATTCTDFYDYDTKLTVFCGGCSTAEWACIDGNDDNCVGGASGLLSTVTWCSELGAEYLVLVHGYSSNAGDFFLDVYDDGVACSDPPLCEEPTGACCVDLVCVETNTEPECDALGGIWYAGQTCPEFECPEPGEGDFCEDPIIVTAPYPVTLFGTNIGMTIDCPGLLDWNAQWYEVELPYALNKLEVSYCPTSVDLYTVGIIYMDDCACDDYVIADSYEFTYGTCPGGYTGCDMEWLTIAGPGVVLVPAYLVDAGANPLDFNVTFNVIDAGLGACCYNQGADCENLHEDECYAAHPDGEFYLGEDCATFECPVPCEESQIDLILLTDAWGYETSWEITVHGTSEVICSGSGYDSYTQYNERCCIAYDGCVDFTIYDSYGDGIYAPGGFTLLLDGEVIFDCLGVGWDGSSLSIMNFGGGCVPDTGACCVDQECVATNTLEECDALGGDWYIFEECPGFMCPPPCGECPENGIPEAEECGDDTNGGCNMTVPQFEPIACNTTVCGTGWFDGSTRDTDWYEFVPDNDDTMTFAVEAEFDVLFGLIEQYVPGQPGCDNITGYVAPYALMPACEWASVSFPVTAGGTYYLFVAPQFTAINPCGSGNNDYAATLTGEACICGDFDNDGDVDVDDFWFFLDAYGTCEGDLKYEAVCDFDGDLCITLVDYQAWMACYRDANGKAFMTPFHRTGRRPGGQQAPGEVVIP
jgi:hypothetical protein